MIALLRGLLVEKAPSRLVVDVGGVGYDVLVPLSTFYVVGESGSTVSLRIHTHVREDVIALYGFATPLEHDLFERLIGINGVGPKLALAVLSGIEPAELVKAIRLQDIARLTAIPGVIERSVACRGGHGRAGASRGARRSIARRSALGAAEPGVSAGSCGAGHGQSDYDQFTSTL
jgi:Holliday junction DNA helicase RuvA subunit